MNMICLQDRFRIKGGDGPFMLCSIYSLKGCGLYKMHKVDDDI